MELKIAEKNKKAGVCYAVTDDGIELPVIDVTHPAFAIELTDSELDLLLQKHLQEIKNQERVPAFVRGWMLRFLQRHSILMHGIDASAGTFLTGMHTYMLKLGADNLNTAYASSIDRSIAGSLPTLSIRLRLQDIAQLLAEDVAPVLNTDAKATLHLLNIGGGPAIDSLNVLIILEKGRPDLLAGRRIFVHSLDLDSAGPNFGSRALTALQAAGGPLHGLDVSFDYIKYDWSDPGLLSILLNSFENDNVAVAASSEGALFEYGSDDEITTNLQALHKGAPANSIIAGTVTRADDYGRLLNSASQAALNLRGLDAFTALALRAGWKVVKVIDRPMSHDVLLEKA